MVRSVPPHPSNGGGKRVIHLPAGEIQIVQHRRTFRTALLSFLVAGGLAAQATPESTRIISLEDLMKIEVITATRSSVTLREAPASVTVLTRDDIRRYGWQTLADALGSLAGFHTFSDRLYDFVVARGFALPNDPNSRILLLVDGHSMVESFGYYNGHLPSPDLSQVERIEVARGPNSASYGTNALFAVINVITRQDAPTSENRVLVEGGSFHHKKITASFRHCLDESTDLLVQGSFKQTGEQSIYFSEYDNPDYGTGGQWTGGQSVPTANQERLGDVSIHLNSQHWAFQALYNDRKKHVPTGLYGGRFDTDQTYFRDTNYFVELGYSNKLAEKTEIKTRAYLDGYQFRGRFMYYPDPTWTLGPPYGSEFNRIEDKAYGVEVLLTTDWNDRHKTLYGLDYKRYGKVLFEYYSENDPDQNLNQYFDRDPNEQVWAVSAMHQYTPNRDWFFQAGLHYDRYRSVGGHLSLRGSMGYQIFDRGWLKLLYGEAFRAPNQWELQGGFFIQGNPQLKPEVVRTGEILLDATLNEYLNFRQSIYLYEVKDTIQAGGSQFENLKGTRGTGLETELRFVKGATSAFGSFSYADVRNEVDQLRVEFAPHWLLKAGLSKQFWEDRFTLGAEIRGVGPRLKSVRTEAPLPSYHVVNLTLSKLQIGRWLELGVSIYNLFDAKYEHPSFAGDLASWNMNSLHKVYDIPADGRFFVVRATLHF